MPTSRSTPPEPRIAPDDADERGSRVMRFGAAVSAVLLASVLATMPVAVRIASPLHGSVGGLSLWIALLALAFCPLGVATVVLRHAVDAIRLFDGKAVATGVVTVLVWGFTMFVGLAVFGAALRATTHHHGLAGVTFACGGIALAAVVALFSARVVGIARDASPALRWGLLAVFGIAIGVSVAFFAHVLTRDGSVSTLVVDITAFAFAAAFGAGAFPHRSRPSAPLALVGPPLAAVVLVVGLATVRGSTPLRAALTKDAPVLAALTVSPLVCP
jgi:hypothetical protein